MTTNSDNPRNDQNENCDIVPLVDVRMGSELRESNGAKLLDPESHRDDDEKQRKLE
jgi:hypothetical protein